MIRLQTDPLDPGDLLAAFCSGRFETGAVISFTGLARGGQGEVLRLELEAYSGFTEAEIGRIAEAAQTRFTLHDLIIIHRIGEILPGEAIVFLATAAAHRRAAFEAADYLMDYLKSRAPFWKKEHGSGGACWIEPTERDLADAARWDG